MAEVLNCFLGPPNLEATHEVERLLQKLIDLDDCIRQGVLLFSVRHKSKSRSYSSVFIVVSGRSLLAVECSIYVF